MKPIPPNTVIHVPTKELDQQVCKIFDDAGLKWGNGKSYLDPSENEWHKNADQTCYRPSDGSYWHIQYFKANGYKILPAEEFIKMNEVDSSSIWDHPDIEKAFHEFFQTAGYFHEFLASKRKPKFSLLCADGIEVNDPEQEVWVVYMDNVHGTLALTKNVNNRALYFSAKSAAQLHLKKTILEKNGISKEDCEMIFRPN